MSRNVISYFKAYYGVVLTYYYIMLIALVTLVTTFPWSDLKTMMLLGELKLYTIKYYRWDRRYHPACRRASASEM